MSQQGNVVTLSTWRGLQRIHDLDLVILQCIFNALNKKKVRKGCTLVRSYSAPPTNMSCETWNGKDMAVEIDGRKPLSISRTKGLLAVFDRVYGSIELELNVAKAIFVGNEPAY